MHIQPTSITCGFGGGSLCCEKRQDGRAGYFRTHVPRARTHFPSKARAVLCHGEMPRTEERIAPGELEAHTVYLVRLESHLGKYPSPDTTLAFSICTKSCARRTRRRGCRSCRARTRASSILSSPGACTNSPRSCAATSGACSPSGSRRTAASTASSCSCMRLAPTMTCPRPRTKSTTASRRSPPSARAHSQRRSQAHRHSQRRTALRRWPRWTTRLCTRRCAGASSRSMSCGCSSSARASPRRLRSRRMQALLLIGRTSGESSVLRPPRPVRDATVPLKLHTTDAYILLVPPPPKLADGAAAAAAPPVHEPLYAPYVGVLVAAGAWRSRLLVFLAARPVTRTSAAVPRGDWRARAGAAARDHGRVMLATSISGFARRRRDVPRSRRQILDVGNRFRIAGFTDGVRPLRSVKRTLARHRDRSV